MKLLAAITVLKSVNPAIDVIAVQSANSPAAYNSWKSKTPCAAENTTFAGGFATGKAYQTTFDIYRDGLDDFMLLSDDDIYRSMALAFYYTQQMVEGAGSATLMAALKLKARLKGKRVVLQMSGGNASADEVEHAITYPEFRCGFE